jgi:zinc transporter ZupT
MPYLEIPPAQVRFRVTNNANSRNYNFSIPFADKCKIIAKDSGYVQTPEALSEYLNLYPFERVELFCDFSDDADGKTYELVDIPTVYQETKYDPRVMKLLVKSSLKTQTMTTRTLPSTLTQLKDLKALYQTLGGKNRSIFLSEMEYTLNCPSKSMIRYRGMEVNTTTIKNKLACTKGKVEKWHFQNPTDDPHPFHWHLVNAQCGATDDEVDTNSLKDVVVIPNDPGAQTVTQVCYVACTPDEFLIEGSTRGATEYNFDTSEPYVAHCHILEHEENNMMSLFQLTDVDDDAPNDDGTTSGSSNKLTSSVIAGAMGMSVLGGFATTISVLVISVERLKFLADSRSLAVAFALSSGVMLFIGLADLWGESLTFYRAAFTTGGTVDPEAYEHGGSSTTAGTCDNTCNGHAYLAVIASFFAGTTIILLVEFLVHGVLDRKKPNKSDQDDGAVTHKDVDLELNADEGGPASPTSPTNLNGAASPSLQRLNIPNSPGTQSAVSESTAAQKRDFHRAGMMTGIAVAIHNFPEGLALFVSSLQGLRTGIVLGIGIILHNMPEGVAVAAPVYYATGSKLEAFKWTAISGIAQPLGAGIGWAAVSGGMSYWLEALLYGLVAGMLVTITVKELLKGAYKFDPRGKLFVPAFFLGVAIIAVSLMALKYAGSS